MKTTFFFLMLFASSVVFAHHPDLTIPGGTYHADVSSSKIIWNGYKVTGKHDGTIALKNGSLIFQNDVLTGGQFEIDMTTIRNTDMAGGGGAAKLEGHLKSPDFFNVEQFPVATFKITKAIPYGVTGEYKVSGDLTIKGITKPVKFMTKVTNNGGSLTATADITVDRSEYDVRYGSGSFFDGLGDKAIHDNFDLKVTLVLHQA